jgi:hypothetical protein
MDPARQAFLRAASAMPNDSVQIRRTPSAPQPPDSGSELIRSGAKKFLLSTGIGIAAGILPMMVPSVLSNPYVMVPMLIGGLANSLYGLWGVGQMLRGVFQRRS